MNLKDVTDIAAAGLAAQRVRLATVASNLANAETTRTAAGGAYQRRDPVFTARAIGGSFADHLERQIKTVEVTRIVTDPRPGVQRHEPGHPDANAEGFVTYPRVNPVEELTNLMSAGRSYEASLVLLRKARQMSDAALQIGR
jgi:flagellar basal-body rod protein FlgC